MFESDDFDQVLLQLDLPEVCPKVTITNCAGANDDELINIPRVHFVKDVTSTSCNNGYNAINNGLEARNGNVLTSNLLSPNHAKRKLINSHFDSHRKRKFPGPAGLLTGNLKEYEDESVSHIELLSQDIDFSQSPLQIHLFESILWKRLIKDVNEWNLNTVQTIKTVKQLAVIGSQRCRKAQTIYAFVENVDRSAIDPLITLRDLTGNIKCTLHRDAWLYFSSYIVPEQSALVLCRPTVLTTGSAFKKHYLNITLSNILAIYSSILINDEEKTFPDGYKKETNVDFTIINMEKPVTDICVPPHIENQDDCSDFLKDLDNVFSEEIF